MKTISIIVILAIISFISFILYKVFNKKKKVIRVDNPSPLTPITIPLFSVQLTYNSPKKFTSCNGSSVNYYINKPNFADANWITTNSTGNVSASIGWYSNGIISKYWAGKGFFPTQICN
jgi:hypothetical protein